MRCLNDDSHIVQLPLKLSTPPPGFGEDKLKLQTFIEHLQYDGRCSRTGVVSLYKGGMLQMVHVSEGVVFRTSPLWLYF